MKFNNNNPYYSPEKCGLGIFDEIDTGAAYEFDMFIIWEKLDDKTLWWATDSGCSCPTPFEDHREDDLKEITLDNFEEFTKNLESHCSYRKSEYQDIRKRVKDFLNTNQKD